MRWGLLLVPLACAGCNAAAIDDRADTEIAGVRSDAAHRVISPTCRDGGLRPGCGLLLEYASTARFRTMFREKKCAGIDRDRCERLYARALDAWLTRRYFAADWSAVRLACDANPRRCEAPRVYELALLDSHDAAVLDHAARTEIAIEDRRAAEHRADVAAARQTAAAMLGDADDVVYQGPRCRSYPSLYGGPTLTECDP